MKNIIFQIDFEEYKKFRDKAGWGNMGKILREMVEKYNKNCYQTTLTEQIEVKNVMKKDHCVMCGTKGSKYSPLMTVHNKVYCKECFLTL